MNKIGILIIAILTLTNCDTTKKTTVHHQNEHMHWAYTGEESPSHWSHLSEEYKDCSGHAQSPINIDDKSTISSRSGHSLNVNYTSSSVNIVNNGHTEQFNIEPGNSLVFDGKTYDLKQFHMHSLSEHTINGEHSPLEIHFVNKAADGTYAVIAVLFEEGRVSPFFVRFLDELPQKEGGYKEKNTFEISDILSDTKHFYHYSGSFTTPPCTEVVEWIVLKEKLTASSSQLEELSHLLHSNYRPIQEVNDRTVDVQ